MQTGWKTQSVSLISVVVGFFVAWALGGKMGGVVWRMGEWEEEGGICFGKQPFLDT